MTSEPGRGLFGSLFSAEAVSAAFDDRATIQAMLDVEAALARAQAKVGLIPQSAVAPIAAACAAEAYDIDALGRAAALAGNTAIPLVKALTEAVRAADEDAARYVHWGATSQDIQDCGLVLQIRAALAPLDSDLQRLELALARLAARHAADPLPGRTWLQHAAPITFGLKAAGYLSALRRARRRLRDAGEASLVLQFGGAAGTLASLGERGMEVSQSLAQELDLALPALPWHAARDRLVDLACTLGVLTGGLGKMARDLSLLMQTDVGEAFEPAAAGKGGSSTMPHKRNPVGCAVALAAAIRVPPLVATMLAAMPQEHERGLGGWHAEWETLPEIFRLTSGALAQMATAFEGLEVDTATMRADLDKTHGLLMAEAASMALAEHVGKAQAHHLVETASRRALADGSSLAEALSAMPEATRHLSADALTQILRPEGYLGAAAAFIQRVLADDGPQS
jgi:3-carboxy-cis,cis-muconate cycloisomerase